MGKALRQFGSAAEAMAGGAAGAIATGLVARATLMRQPASPTAFYLTTIFGGLVAGWGLSFVRRDAGIGFAAGAAGLGLAVAIGNALSPTPIGSMSLSGGSRFPILSGGNRFPLTGGNRFPLLSGSVVLPTQHYMTTEPVTGGM